MKSLHKICCEELNPIFDEIADLSIKRDRQRVNSEEWKSLDDQLGALFHHAQLIFLHYNPDYKISGKKR